MNNKSLSGKKIVHQVYFWLKPGLSAAQVTAFENGVMSLLNIDTVVYGDVGKPAPTPDRDVIQKDYHYALLTVFQDVNGHDLYQEDPIHQKFLDDCKQFFGKVVVYDAESL
ncbi:MAG: Dabb family protein [Cytophagales bacterium]|nr:Dabb family protein [Cytophagales bacterium]